MPLPDGQKAPGISWMTRASKLVSNLVSRRRRILRLEAADILASGLFDASWYAQRYPDVVEAGLAPLDHYLAHGAGERRDPGPRFNSAAYLHAYPDVAQAGLNPLVHYVRHGRSEGRIAVPAGEAPAVAAPASAPAAGDVFAGFSEKDALAILRACDLFDGAWYLARNPDVAQAAIEPALHYLHHGGREGRDPGPTFSGHAYLLQNPEAAGTNPLLHYLTSRADMAEKPSAALVLEPPSATGRSAVPFVAATPPALWRSRGVEGIRFGVGTVVLGGAVPGTPEVSVLRHFLALVADLANLRAGVSPWQEDAAGGRTTWDAATSDAADPQPARILRFEAAGAPLFADAWFTTSHDLRVRLSGAGEGGIVTCLVCDPVDGTLAPCEGAVGADGLAFLDIATFNPFLPLLFILTDGSGRLVATTLLPFPSLCRGGLHHAEALAEKDAVEGLEAVRTASARLLAAWEAAGRAPALDVIHVDVTGATGAERMFGAALRAWLGPVLGIGIEPSVSACTAQRPATQWLRDEVRLEGRRRPNRSGRVLHLMWDAVPALHALLAESGAGPAPLILCEGVDGQGLWHISPPHAPVMPAGLQPAAMEPFPRLEGAPGVAAASMRAAALRFAAPGPRHAASLQAPVPPDIPAVRILPAARAQAPAISVLLSYCNDDVLAGGLLAALAQQEAAGGFQAGLQVILMADEDVFLPALAVLRRHFPETGHLVPLERDERLHDRFNRAAALAHGDLLLILGDSVILHDCRTVSLLAGMLAAPEVASAACMLVAATDGGRGDDLQLVGLGTHRRAGTGRRRNFSELSLEDSLAALPPAVWPVPANSLSLALVRREDWAAHGGFAEDGGGLGTGFFAATSRAGRLHLASTALCATCAEPGPASVVAPEALPGAGMAAARIVA